MMRRSSNLLWRRLQTSGGLLLALLGLPAAAAPGALPPVLLNALRAAQIEPTALGLLVQPLDADSPSWAWQADKPLNPASLVKLITSAAALDTLGPAWQWQTPVWLQGTLDEQGRLDGTLTIQGSGDPRLGIEPLNTALRRLQTQLGLREVRGPLVLDRSAFAPDKRDPADFDGEPWRVGNALPEALLLQAKSITFNFRPEGRQVRITAEPPFEPPQTLPLASGPCGDWREALKLDWSRARVRFAGSYPQACGEQAWTLADPDPASYPARLLTQLAHEQGLRWAEVREGPAPPEPPTLRIPGPTVAEAVRDMNKHSSNLMAQQLLLSLARAAGVAPVNGDTAAAWLQTWFDAHGGRAGGVASRLVNGSGLARETRVTAAQLAALLRWGWQQPWMPEWLASLPVAGLDGTLARQPTRYGPALGRAHLKTGTLRDATALGGIVHTRDGRRLIVVALVNHPQAGAARPALDALLRWLAQDAEAPATTAAAAGPSDPPASAPARHSPTR